MNADIWVKFIAIVSFISAAVLVGGCTSALKDNVRDLTSQLHDSGVAQIEPHAKTTKDNIVVCHNNKVTYDDVLRDVKEVRKNNQPIMTSLCAVAMLIGTIQLLASFSLLMSDSKTSEKPLQRWIIVHSLVIIALVILLLSTMAVKSQHGKTSNHWSDLVDHFHKKLMKEQPNEDFTILINDLKNV